MVRRAFLLGVLMVATSVAAKLLQPRPVIGSVSDIPNLESVIPSEFGEWRLDRSIVPLEVAPDVAATLSAIYDKTLARTYINSKGQRVMLSLAYGANQSRALQLHKPEVCYVAQGFNVGSLSKTNLKIAGFSLPVMHMVAQQGSRVEPITYWMRMGDDIARGWFEQNKARLKYGLRGEIPDGLLFRMSNISSDTAASYALQADFAAALLEAVPPATRHMLAGGVDPV